MPLSAFALKELSERVDMSSAEGRAKFLQDARPLVKRIGAPMLGLVLRKRVAELAGITQAELEQRFEIGAAGALRSRSRRAALRSGLGVDPYAKLLERLLAEPRLLLEIRSDLPRPRQPAAEAAALLDLIEQARALPGELRMSRDAIELLRERGHDAVLQRLLPMVHDLEGLSVEELAVEVRAHVDSLHRSAQQAEADRAVAGVSSPAELSEQDRELVTRALGRAEAGPKATRKLAANRGFSL